MGICFQCLSDGSKDTTEMNELSTGGENAGDETSQATNQLPTVNRRRSFSTKEKMEVTKLKQLFWKDTVWSGKITFGDEEFPIEICIKEGGWYESNCIEGRRVKSSFFNQWTDNGNFRLTYQYEAPLLQSKQKATNGVGDFNVPIKLEWSDEELQMVSNVSDGDIINVRQRYINGKVISFEPKPMDFQFAGVPKIQYPQRYTDGIFEIVQTLFKKPEREERDDDSAMTWTIDENSVTETVTETTPLNSPLLPATKSTIKDRLTVRLKRNSNSTLAKERDTKLR